MTKADQALAARRAEDILHIRLDGAEWWDVVQFVREKQTEQGSAWFVADGETPLSDAMIRKYQERADRLMFQSHEKSRKKLFRRHLAQRRSLYSTAVMTGDIGTALRCLRDEGEMLGLYATQIKPRVPGPEKDRKTQLAESLAFYQAIVNSRAPLPDRMRAQERIDRLSGLDFSDMAERIEMLELILKQRSEKP